MAHTIYKNKESKRVPSVTTILGILDKPALKFWGNKIGLQGIKITEYVDDKALIGTLAHYRAECHILKKELDFSQFDCTQEQINQSEICFNKYLEWESYQYELTPIANEIPLVSEKYQYAGCADFICKLNGKVTLIDFKTCNSIFSEAYMQTIAYKELIEENKIVDKIEQIVILRIGRDESEGFEYIEVPEELYKTSFDIFLNCLKIYNAKKEFNKILKNSKNKEL